MSRHRDRSAPRSPGRRGVGRAGATRGRPGTRTDRWLGSWRLALRLARREVARHPWRSVLILALVGVPLAVLSAFAVWFASTDLSRAEQAARVVGTAAARLEPTYNEGGVGQVVDAEFLGWEDGGELSEREPEVVEGFAAADTWTAERVAATTGEQVATLGTTTAQPPDALPGRWFDEHGPWHVLALDATEFEGAQGGGQEAARGGAGSLAGIATLTSGRWPDAADEVLVTPSGAARGLAASGQVSVTFEGADSPSTLTVVGTGTAVQSGWHDADLVLSSAGAPESTRWSYLVLTGDPVDLERALAWAGYGLDVTTPVVSADPPPAPQGWGNSRAEQLFTLLLAAAVVVETMLLAGPAFAVSAVRQRHSLALAAAQGAGAPDVRRAVTAYGVILAVVAAVGGALLGGLGGAGWVLWRLRQPVPTAVTMDVPWSWILALVAVAVLAGAVAAWWPARGLTRLDTMAVLRGQVASRRVGRGWPVLGGGLAGLGVLALLWAAFNASDRSAVVILGAGVLIMLGLLLLLPALLALVARLSGGAPVALRLATRDALRQRSRSIPAMAAIVAATAVMAGIATVQMSSTANQERQYQPRLPAGTAEVWVEELTEERLAEVVTTVESTVPGTVTYPVVGIPAGPGWRMYGGFVEEAPVQAVIPPGCETTYTVQWEYGDDDCLIDLDATHLVMPVELLERTGHLDERAREAVSEGALLATGAFRWVLPEDASTLSVLTGVGHASERSEERSLVGESQVVEVPVQAVEPAQMSDLAVPRAAPATIMTPQTAQALGWSGEQTHLVVVHPDRDLTADDERALVSALQGAYGDHFGTYVEHGFRQGADSARFMLVLLGAFSLLALSAVVISTALTISEGQRDSATLAAVGGTRRTRRMLAATHSWVMAGVGSVLGVGLGVAVGAAAGWVSSTTDRFGGFGYMTEESGALPGLVSVPWLPLLLVVLTLPVVAAAIGWLSVRRAPTLVRRTV